MLAANDSLAGTDLNVLLGMDDDRWMELGLPHSAVRRLREWLLATDAHACGHENRVGSASALVERVRPFQGGKHATATLPADLQTLLAREQPILGLKMRASLEAHAAREDPRVARYVRPAWRAEE